MTVISDYSILDRPEVLRHIFHPRPDWGSSRHPQSLLIPVTPDVSIGACFHIKNREGANILFFHGNGEIVSDYDELGDIYNQLGINFLPVDYRGYGQSSGSPTVASMMRDCHAIFEFTIHWLEERQHTGPLIVMGRSLGSASALELASRHKTQIDGLIVESGFAFSEPLLNRLGVNTRALSFTEKHGFENLDRIKVFDKPVLIIHAEFDHIIPFSDGQALYDACPSSTKRLLKIPGADHNDIVYRGLPEYMKAVTTLADSIMK